MVHQTLSSFSIDPFKIFVIYWSGLLSIVNDIDLLWALIQRGKTWWIIFITMLYPTCYEELEVVFAFASGLSSHQHMSSVKLNIDEKEQFIWEWKK